MKLTIFIIVFIVVVGAIEEVHSGEILDLSYYQYAVLEATKINPDYHKACPQVYKQALYDGKIEKARGPDGRMAPVQMELSRIYWNCMRYWSARKDRREKLASD